MKTRSLLLYFFSKPTKKVDPQRAVTPIRITARPFKIIDGSNLLNRTAAPTVLNSKGWQNIQKMASSCSGLSSPHCLKHMKPKKMMKMNFDSGKPVRSAAKGAAIARATTTKNLGHLVFLGSHLLNSFMRKPKTKASRRPTKICRQTSPSSAQMSAPPSSSPPGAYVKATVRKMLKTEIAMISSKLDAAIRVVGMPFFVPYFAFCRIMQEGTSTAGLTAPRQ